MTTQSAIRTELAAIDNSLVDLFDATLTANKVAAEHAKLNEKQAGVYVTTIDLAIVSGSLESFNGTVNRYFKLIRSNANGIAIASKCALAKDGETFVVPGSLSNAVSVMRGAFEHSIDLVDGDDSRAFGAIRKEVQAARKAAQQAEADANKTDVEEMQEEIAATLLELAELVPTLTGAPLAEMQSMVATLRSEWAGNLEQAAKAA